MDIEHYNNIYNYLKYNQLPSTLNNQQQQQIQKQSVYFIIKNNFIYKKDKKKQNNLLRVIRRHELEPVLFMFHNDPTAAHFSVDTMFDKIQSRYYWPQMYNDIRSYVMSCDSCQRRGKQKTKLPLHPIPVESPFHQIGIDFVGPLPITTNGNKYIITAMDYLTKWPEARPVKEATAEQAALFIYEEIICRHGCPAKILSDQGTHFRNQIIEKLMEKFQIKHLFSTPYHPQTNGLVERFNRTLSESLARLSTDHIDNWDNYIAPILFAYRTTKHSTTKIAPFFLLYGRDAKLPTDSLENNGNPTLINHIENLVDQLPQEIEIAKTNIEISQQKQKERHDRKLRHQIKFSIGDKVLYYDAAKEKQWTGKLNPKWKGPYYIHQVGEKGAYKLRTIDGKVLQTPVNGSLLKLYHDRQNWEPIIVV
ncbi:putative integrase core domain protein [Rhizophagus irregularis DAOM 181602=DAOM 197198]|nr:putative integrase core domain protein [Rhizophagus irregularis DAOM 181602=DAOM 197198]